MSGIIMKEGIEVISRLQEKPRKSRIKVFLNICSEVADNKSCQLNIKYIASMTSLSERAVQLSISYLIEKGVITRVLIPQEGSVFTVNMEAWNK